MKNPMLFLLLTVSISANGQDWFSKHNQNEATAGYIITINGDTIQGSVIYDYPVVMQKRITFAKKGDTEPKIYQPKDIRGYGCGGRFWESVNVTFQTYNGPVKFNRFGILYAGNTPLQLLRIFPEKDKMKKKMSSTRAEVIYNKIPVSQPESSFKNLYLKKLEDPAEDLNSPAYKKDFIGSIAKKVSDDADLMKKINGKEYRYKDLEKIVSEYNAWFLAKRYNNAH